MTSVYLNYYQLYAQLCPMNTDTVVVTDTTICLYSLRINRVLVYQRVKRVELYEASARAAFKMKS